MFTERFLCNEHNNKALMVCKTLTAEEGSFGAGTATFGAEHQKTKVTQTRL
jgi:hypothetical protein